MNCQLCNKVLETYEEWLLGECPGDLDFGHRLSATEAATLKQRQPPNTTPTTPTRWTWPA